MHAHTLTQLTHTKSHTFKDWLKTLHCKREELMMQYFYSSTVFTELKSQLHTTENARLEMFTANGTQNPLCGSHLICLLKFVSASCIHLGILQHLSPPWPQRSCVNTRTQHALSHQSACHGCRGMDLAHVPALNKERRRVSTETWKRKEEQKLGQTFI